MQMLGWAGGRSPGRAQSACHATPSLRVFVVDDDPLAVLYLSQLLQDEGFSVACFEDPGTALQAYRTDPASVDVVVTDHCMPALTGEALARAMLQCRPSTRIILCTAFGDLVDERRALAVGIQHYLRKPFDARRLIQAIRGAPRRGD